MKASTFEYTWGDGNQTVDGYDVRAGAILSHVSDGSKKKVSAVDRETGRALCRKPGRPAKGAEPEYEVINLSEYKTVNATVWEEVDA
jgi:hypothetical protein